jgi:hypothetical protein
MIGMSISTDGVAKLVRSLAKDVHQVGGAVIYINRGKLPSSRWVRHFDLHLQTNVDVWAADVFEYLAAVGVPDNDSSSRTWKTHKSIQVGLEVMPFIATNWLPIHHADRLNCKLHTCTSAQHDPIQLMTAIQPCSSHSVCECAHPLISTV